MSKNIGIEQTGEVLDFFGSFVTTTGNVAADGKVSLIELTQYFSLWPVIAPAFDGIKNVEAELGDLDSTERNALKERFARALKLSNPVTEELLEEGTDLALHLTQFILKVRQIRKGNSGL